MTTESNGPDILLDFFRNIGTPLSLRRDNAKMQASAAWQDILRKYYCKDQFIEPYNPQQNTAERRIGMIKNTMKRIMRETNCDPQAWYHLAQHVADVKNHVTFASLHWHTLLEVLIGNTPNILGLLHFKFWDWVMYYDPPTEGEQLGRWLGRASSDGDTMCNYILKLYILAKSLLIISFNFYTV